MSLVVKPETVSVSSGSMVISHNIIGVCNPERSGGLVCVEETPRSLSLNSQIAVNIVVCFDCVFNEECVTHSIVSNILLYSQVLDTMDCYCSVVRVIDGVSHCIRVFNCSDDMEMTRISTKLESLTNISHFNISYLSN